MAQINKPDTYFNTVLYTGTGANQSITGVNFQPDLVWCKQRTNIRDNQWLDAVRGVNTILTSNGADAETTSTTNLLSFDSDGFSLGSAGNINNASNDFVSWNWLASNTTASNTDGSITSTVSANTTSGFSIVSYTGNGTAGATIGTGLNAVPSMVIVKNRDLGTEEWEVYFKGVTTADNQSLALNTTSAVFTRGSPSWDVSEFSSSVFSVGSNNVTNGSSNNMIAYCFAEKKGFSKFGSYTGNGSADGTFVYTGFKPAFVIVKRTDAIQSWYILDNKRNTFNPEDKYFKADASSAEDTLSFFDFLSNGFKARGTGIGFNASGGSYIYMAFAESPLVGTNNIPAVAR